MNKRYCDGCGEHITSYTAIYVTVTHAAGQDRPSGGWTGGGTTPVAYAYGDFCSSCASGILDRCRVGLKDAIFRERTR